MNKYIESYKIIICSITNNMIFVYTALMSIFGDNKMWIPEYVLILITQRSQLQNLFDIEN